MRLSPLSLRSILLNLAIIKYFGGLKYEWGGQGCVRRYQVAYFLEGISSCRAVPVCQDQMPGGFHVVDFSFENAVRVLVKMKTVVPVKPFPVVTDDVLRLALLDFPIIVLEAFDGVG